MEQGLLAEVQALLRRGLPPAATAMQAIGYKELMPVLRAGAPLEQAVEKIKQESRRYAKRQLTWLRRDPALHWLIWEKNPDIVRGLQDSTNFLEECGML